MRRVVDLSECHDFNLSTTVDELSAPESPDVDDWALRLSACLPPLAHGATSVLPTLTDLANQYFNHVGLACMSLSF